MKRVRNGAPARMISLTSESHMPEAHPTVGLFRCENYSRKCFFKPLWADFILVSIKVISSNTLPNAKNSPLVWGLKLFLSWVTQLRVLSSVFMTPASWPLHEDKSQWPFMVQPWSLKPWDSIFCARTAEDSAVWADETLGDQEWPYITPRTFTLKHPMEATSCSKWQIKTNPRALFCKNIRHVFFWNISLHCLQNQAL